MHGWSLLWVTALHLGLTAAPLMATVLLAARRGVRDVAMLLGIGLLGSGASAIVSFWAYFATPGVGHVVSYVVVVGSLAVVAWCGRGVSGQFLKRLATPLLLWGLATFFLVFLGFLHGGVDQPLETAAVRFSHPLPVDHALPLFFGNWFYVHGHQRAPPPISEARSSDRPPLQTGYVLEQRVPRWNPEESAQLHYQLLGVALQQFWVFGLWALLEAARVRVVTRALAVISVLLSDVAIVHGFFVWPKMLAASFLLAAAALLLTPRWSDARHRPVTAVLVAGLFALAMLAHATSIFGILPLAVLAAVRGLPSWRWLATGTVVAVTLLAPWALYRRYFDPPGNRLTKEALAGIQNIDRRSTAQAVVDSYRAAGFSRVFDNKAHNFVTMTVGEGDESVSDIPRAVRLATSGDVTEAVRVGRGVRFFALVLSLGPFVLAPAIMLVARRWRRPEPAEWSLAVTCLACVAVGCLLWGLILFGPTQAVIHQGSLALPVLAITGALVGLRAVVPRLAVAVVQLNIAVVLVLYVPAIDPTPGSRYSTAAATAIAASLIGFVTVALRSHEPTIGKVHSSSATVMPSN